MRHEAGSSGWGREAGPPSGMKAGGPPLCTAYSSARHWSTQSLIVPPGMAFGPGHVVGSLLRQEANALPSLQLK
jgi:hypothetical protein